MKPLPMRISLIVAGTFWATAASAENIACVGDSITYGYGLSNPNTESYPAVLQELLGQEHTVGNFGVSGATLLKSGDKPYWNESRYADSDAFNPDVVIVMLGTNDAKPGNWSQSASFAPDYQDLIAHYRALGAVVYVATPPRVFGAGAFEISPTVVENEVVPLVEQLATSEDTPLIDVFEATRLSEALFPDTVHPNAAGARLIAETVEAVLIENGFASPDTMGTGGTGEEIASGGNTGAGGAISSGGMPGSGGETTENASGGGDSSSGGATPSGGSTSPDAAGGQIAVNTSAGGSSTGGAAANDPGTESGGAMQSDEPPAETGAKGCQFWGRSHTPWRLPLLGIFLIAGAGRARRRPKPLSALL